MTTAKRKPLNQHLRVQVLSRDGYKCRMCGRSKDEVALEVDHVLAVAEGGTDELSNLATLCRACNGGKSAYRFADYRSMEIAPPEIAEHFAFFEDDPIGDYRKFHLYLYFFDAESGNDKFEHSWTISGSRSASSKDAAALELRRRSEETLAFIAKIRAKLIADTSRLVVDEDGVHRVGGYQR